MSKYYISTAIAYASKTPHIGNVSEAVFTDALARYHRLIGDDVFFLTGTDEHGLKIQEQANAEGITPEKLTARISDEVESIWKSMDVSYDRFIRTTEPEHKRRVQDIFSALYKQGDIYKSAYQGWYCTADEAFYTETQVGEDAVCPDCGQKVQKAEEEAYFFRLSKYAGRLLEHIEANESFILPQARKNEMVNNFIKPGLQDLCVSRTSFSWGVPVEFDPGHVVYVWIDALSNYITALGFETNGTHGELYLKYWPADVHVIGKDIARFHTIYWPCILMALGQPLPKRIYGHGWFLFGQDKMSKSKGNVLYAQELLEEFTVDALRYYLLREMPYSGDGSITRQQLCTRINSDLANDLGNLLSRTTAMAQKYFGGKPGGYYGMDDRVKEIKDSVIERYKELMDEMRVAAAIAEVFKLIGRANKFIDETEPWKLAKDPAAAKTLEIVVYSLCESLRAASVLLAPIMPKSALEIASQLGTKEFVSWESLRETGIIYSCAKGCALFPRMDK